MLLLIFESTHAVISAEKKFIDAGFRPKVIPVPRSISSQCGMALEFTDQSFPIGQKVGDKEDDLEEKLNMFMEQAGIRARVFKQ